MDDSSLSDSPAEGCDASERFATVVYWIEGEGLRAPSSPHALLLHALCIDSTYALAPVEKREVIIKESWFTSRKRGLTNPTLHCW
mmetsp:Transcript_44538/g.81341  ORF Transcript_44538/g.81341 Transcript_44538/m.81341 type:complete len:85 (-) Transcript_44538:168-422(-)